MTKETAKCVTLIFALSDGKQELNAESWMSAHEIDILRAGIGEHGWNTFWHLYYRGTSNSVSSYEWTTELSGDWKTRLSDDWEASCPESVEVSEIYVTIELSEDASKSAVDSGNFEKYVSDWLNSIGLDAEAFSLQARQ